MPFPPRRAGASRRRVGALAAVLLAAAIGLTACTTPSPGPEPGPSSGGGTTSPATPEAQTPPPVLHPDGSAEENHDFFTETLRAYAKGTGPIEGRPVVDALVKAGFEPKRMQVSFDRTRTGLVADNLFVSVRIGKDCLIGQILTADRGVYTEVAAAVGPGQKLCLIGKTRPIDW